MYILNGTQIRAPHSMREMNDTQMAQQRTLNGSINRDYFGSNKREWQIDYNNVLPAVYNTIKSIYNTYLSTAVAVTLEVTEANYTIVETTVHITFKDRGFNTKGEDYLSDFTLILTEA